VKRVCKTGIVSIWRPFALEQSLKNIKRFNKVQIGFYPGDLVTHTGAREILSTSGRLLDNLGELA